MILPDVVRKSLLKSLSYWSLDLDDNRSHFPTLHYLFHLCPAIAYYGDSTNFVRILTNLRKFSYHVTNLFAVIMRLKSDEYQSLFDNDGKKHARCYFLCCRV